MNQPLNQPVPQPLKLTRLQRLFLMVTQGRVLHVIKNRIKPLLIRVGQAAMNQPVLKQMADKMLDKSPALKLRVHRILWSEVNLPTRALQIFTDLKDAVDQQTRPQAAAHTPPRGQA